ncbi:MAG: hypothetical protein WBO29_12205, partial [Albidovulum sp.]
IKTIDSILDELENFVSQNPHSKAIAEARLARIFSSTAAPSKVTQETTITGKRPWSKEMKITKAEGRRNPATFVKEVYEAEIMNRSLTRSSLEKADPALSRAYATWIHRHPADDLGLAKTSHKVDHDLEALKFIPARELSRLASAARRRKM